MKCLSVLSAVVAFCSLVSCETTMNPISSSSFDPLRQPGSGQLAKTEVAPGFTPGQFVQAAIDNTAFFKKAPGGDADADKILGRATSMKVISISGSYVKVELDSGEIGYVPAVMLEDPKAVIQPYPASPNEYQVYPPLPSPATGVGEPLPVIDPAGQPPANAVPTTATPEGAGGGNVSGSMPLPPNGTESKPN
ncbi:MAG: hypothetical protein WCL19_02625 [Verrucomicrobiota bacterium]